MLVSTDWLKELVDLKVLLSEVVRLLPLRTIGTKEITDNFIELDMKGYNRADLLSMRGVAYEIAAITNSTVNFSEEPFTLKATDTIQVIVDDNKRTPLYCIAKIEGLKVGQSSADWVKKLSDSGIRSINNVADVTNLVMLEFGQPLHAFDADKIKDQTLIVRTAKPGETLVTLDNKTRNLEPTDLLITDPEKALGLAGVMGGKNSEIIEDTTSILLEAAIFDPVTLRQTAQRLNLPSEASKRFQHGLTKTRLLQALQAAVKMYEKLGGKLTSLSITGDTTDKTVTLKLTQGKLNSLVGVNIAPEFVESSLKSLHFKVKEEDREHSASQGPTLRAWDVTVPYWRLDIEVEEDLIEEVARMYGYENIPPQELKGELPPKIDQSIFELIYKLKTKLVDLGLTEIQTYSFYSTAVLYNLEGDREKLIKVANPMSAETEYMRDLIWPNLLEKTAENLKYRDDVAIFEIGKVYLPRRNEMPNEKYHLAIALSNGSTNPIAELNEIIKKLNPSLETREDTTDSALIHPTRHIALMQKGHQVGIIAEAHPRVVNRFHSEERVAIAELDLGQLN